MTTSSAYSVYDSHHDPTAEIQRLAAQAHMGWEKEAQTLAWFGLHDGVSVLELGSGPGFVTEQLLTLLPSSRITCLEHDPALIQQAKHYLQDQANGRVRFVEASIMDTRLGEHSFDFAYARYLFQHLPDPVGAAAEVWRVLKPGGRFVIYDIDDEFLAILDPPVPEMAAVMEKYRHAQAARGGNRRIGRRLWRILKAAGFHKLDLEVKAIHSDQVGIEQFRPQLTPDSLLPLVKLGVLSEQEFETVRSACEQFLAAPDPYILTLSWMICGEKPD